MVNKMPIDEYGNKLNGFYLIGFFDKNKIGKFLIQKEKPFTTDENGISHGKCFPGYPSNSFPTNWLFFETDIKIKDAPKDKDLKEYMEDTWKDWCKEHKRKLDSIFANDNKQEKKGCGKDFEYKSGYPEIPCGCKMASKLKLCPECVKRNLNERETKE